MQQNIYEIAKNAFLYGDKPEHVSDIAPKYTEDYKAKFREKVEEGLKRFDGDFYILMMFFRDKSIKFGNAYKVMGRACRGVGSPTFLNDMWKYHRNSDTPELLWSIPSIKECTHMARNKHKVLPEEYPSLRQVLNFLDGTYNRLCSEENEKVARRLNNAK